MRIKRGKSVVPMVVSSAISWRPQIFNAHKNGYRLNRGQREALINLRNIWLEIALDILQSPTNGSVPKIIGITSVSDAEDKTVSALGIATAMAIETDDSVLLLEADVNNPHLVSDLGLWESPGLYEYLGYDTSIEQIIQQTELPNFDIVVAGGKRDDEPTSIEVWGNPKLNQLKRGLPNALALMKESYRFIFVELPPVLNNIYAKEFLDEVDGAYLIVWAGVTPVDGVKSAIEQMGEKKLAGILLGGAAAPLPDWVMALLST